MISFASAQIICLLLMAADMVARTWRIIFLLRGLGQDVSFRDAVILNVFGDAASALTPARLGGEPARLAGMLRADVRPEAGIVAISYEVIASWPVIILSGGTLLWLYAPEWMATTGPLFLAEVRQMWPWLILVVVASGLAALLARRMSGPWTRHIRRPARRLRHYWRRMPPGPLLLSAPLALVNLVARTAILPVLALSLPEHPALGPMVLGSFALLYSQLILPTPGGAGGVEFGFLAGAAGQFGSSEGTVLLLWRFYTLGLGVLVGGYFLVTLYGWPTIRRLLLPRRMLGAAGPGAPDPGLPEGDPVESAGEHGHI